MFVHEVHRHNYTEPRKVIHSIRIFRRSAYCCIPRLPLQRIQHVPNAGQHLCEQDGRRRWNTLCRDKRLPVYLELTDVATFRGSYNERISATFNNGSGLAHCFTQNSNRN